MTDQPTMEDLGRRAVACKGWRWMAGMRMISPEAARWVPESPEDIPPEPEYVINTGKAGFASANLHGIASWSNKESCLPDLTDPATLGCLLALVREAPGGRRASRSAILAHGFGTPAFAEALVVALEAAPDLCPHGREDVLSCLECVSENAAP